MSANLVLKELTIETLELEWERLSSVLAHNQERIDWLLQKRDKHRNSTQGVPFDAAYSDAIDQHEADFAYLQAIEDELIDRAAPGWTSH